MKKILLIADFNPNKFGTFEEFTLFLAKELSQRGHLLYLGFIAEPETVLMREFENANARMLNFSYRSNTIVEGYVISRLMSKIHEIVRTYRYIKENNIELVHINFYRLTDPRLLGVYFTGVKIAFTEHCSGLPRARSPLKYIASKAIHFFIARKVVKYIAVSEFVKERLSQTHHIRGDKTITLYNGVNIERFKPRTAIEDRSDLNFPLDKHVICAIAMLIPEKGIHYLIRAVAVMVHKHSIKDVFVVIVGEGYYRVELEKLVDEFQLSEYVRFLGKRNDVHSIISASDVVVVPSVWAEAFGIIIAEAMASARPVVATNVGGIPELVDDGSTGLLVEPADVKGLASALLKLISNPHLRAKMGEEGRMKAISQFNLDCQVKTFATLCEDLIATNSRPLNVAGTCEIGSASDTREV